jgi:hypothetical protein
VASSLPGGERSDSRQWRHNGYQTKAFAIHDIAPTLRGRHHRIRRRLPTCGSIPHQPTRINQRAFNISWCG